MRGAEVAVESQCLCEAAAMTTCPAPARVTASFPAMACRGDRIGGFPSGEKALQNTSAKTPFLGREGEVDVLSLARLRFMSSNRTLFQGTLGPTQPGDPRLRHRPLKASTMAFWFSRHYAPFWDRRSCTGGRRAIAGGGDRRLEAQAVIGHASLEPSVVSLPHPYCRAVILELRHGGGEVGLQDARIEFLLGDGVAERWRAIPV